METLGGPALPHAVARHLLDRHADRLPDLSGLTVLVPNHRAGLDLARALAQGAGRPVLIPPHLTPLKSWAESTLKSTSLADGHAEPQARRLARLHGVLRHQDWLGAVDKWALANELLLLADELSAARLGDAIGSRIRALHGGALDRETALIEGVWQALNTDGSDPQARYARALDTLFEQLRAAPRPVYGYALGMLTAVEQGFLARCAEHVPLTLFEQDTGDDVAFALRQAWQETAPPLRERAALLAQHCPASPLQAASRSARRRTSKPRRALLPPGWPASCRPAGVASR